MACWLTSRRRAEMARPCSQRVPASTRKPSLSRIDPSFRWSVLSLAIKPYDQHACRSQEGREPVQLGFESLDRCSRQSTKPTSYRPRRRPQDAAVTTRLYPRRCSSNMWRRLLRSRHDNSMQLGTAGELDHRLDDFLARGCREVGLVHDRSPVKDLIGVKSRKCVATRPAEAGPARWPWSAGLRGGLALMSNSRTSGTMITACGRWPFSNMAYFSASARSTKRPPRRPL